MAGEAHPRNVSFQVRLTPKGGRNAIEGWAEGPDGNTEYLLYQTLVGAWPIEAERIKPYMEKAAREAKSHTSWTSPQPAFESALASFLSC